MEHSANFNKVKDYYDRGLWDKTRVANAVLKGWITEAEYEEIVGKPMGDVSLPTVGNNAELEAENADMKNALNLLGVNGEEVVDNG